MEALNISKDSVENKHLKTLGTHAKAPLPKNPQHQVTKQSTAQSAGQLVEQPVRKAKKLKNLENILEQDDGIQMSIPLSATSQQAPISLDMIQAHHNNNFNNIDGQPISHQSTMQHTSQQFTVRTPQHVSIRQAPFPLHPQPILLPKNLDEAIFSLKVQNLKNEKLRIDWQKLKANYEHHLTNLTKQIDENRGNHDKQLQDKQKIIEMLQKEFVSLNESASKIEMAYKIKEEKYNVLKK